jgi:hypothetical protein
MRPKDQDPDTAPDTMLLAMVIEQLRDDGAQSIASLSLALGMVMGPLDDLGSGLPPRVRAILLGSIRRETRSEQTRLRHALAWATARDFVFPTETTDAPRYAATPAGLRWSIATYEECGRETAHGGHPQALAASLCSLLCSDPCLSDGELMERLVPVPEMERGADTAGRRAMFAAMAAERPRVLEAATKTAVELGWLTCKGGTRILTALGSSTASSMQNGR